MKVPGTICAAEGLSERTTLADAVREVCDPILEDMGGSPDIAVLFVTPHHIEHAEDLTAALQAELKFDALTGCTASGVIAKGKEVQSGPGIALWCARLPGCRAQSFRLYLEKGEEGGLVRGWPNAGEDASLVLLADPFTFPTDPFLNSLRKEHKSPRLLGGLAGGTTRSKEVRLFSNDQVVSDGAVGLVMDGAAELCPLVSQGCRPIGTPFRITRAEQNFIYELEGVSAYQTLTTMMQELEEEDRMHFQSGPQVGLFAVEGGSKAEKSGAGYLIRPLVGVDSQSGAVAIGAFVEEGAMMQFHARDEKSAHRELQGMLEFSSAMNPKVAGGLLFSCNGRGSHMFEQPNHDVELIRKYYPDLPVTGMFANGEIGPVFGKPYLHGFTASIGLLTQSGV